MAAEQPTIMESQTEPSLKPCVRMAEASCHSLQRGVMLRVCPTSLAEANAYVSANHRHHDPVTGHKFSIAVADAADRVRGVAIIGRPVSRHMDDGWTLEVNRCCTDGTRNACSMLYRAAWRAASAMGYRRMITYTLPEEGGGSLKGAGFKLVGERGGGMWTRKNRPRIDTHPTQTKWLWELADTSAKQHNGDLSNRPSKSTKP